MVRRRPQLRTPTLACARTPRRDGVDGRLREQHHRNEHALLTAAPLLRALAALALAGNHKHTLPCAAGTAVARIGGRWRGRGWSDARTGWLARRRGCGLALRRGRSRFGRRARRPVSQICHGCLTSRRAARSWLGQCCRWPRALVAPRHRSRERLGGRELGWPAAASAEGLRAAAAAGTAADAPAVVSAAQERRWRRW